MTVQLPPEVQGAAAGVLFYTFVCLFCSIALFSVAWANGDRLNYISLLAIFTGMSSVSSIAQQINTILWWRNLKFESIRHILNDPTNPELVLIGSSIGANLVLFYIQYYAWNVEAILATCWAADLAFGVLRARLVAHRYTRRGEIWSKILAVLLPIVQTGLVQTSAVQWNTVVFLVVSNAIMAICLCSGSILIFAIFLKYVTVQIKRSSVRCVDTELDSVPSNYGIVHEWGLILRFVIAFLGTSALELAMILIQISIAERNKTVFTGEPDFSVESAKLDFVLFMPGVSASLICFAVFGTTKTYVDYLSRLLMPIHVFKKTQGGGQRVTVSIA